MLDLSWRVNILFPNLGAISSVLKLPSTHHVQFSKQRQSEWTAINSLCGSYLMTEFEFSCYITNVLLQKTRKCHAKRFLTMDVDDIQERQKYVKLIWNFERNLSIFITRNDIYGLTVYMSVQCAKGWTGFITFTQAHNKIALCQGSITNMNWGSINYNRAYSSWITSVEHPQFLKMGNHLSSSD